MSVNRDKLDLRLIEETIFWEFWELFSKFCNRRRSDLPQYKTPAFKLDPFKLAEIFYDCKDDPSPALLMDAVEFRSPLMEKVFEDYYETLSHHLLDCFKAAMQRIRIDEQTQELLQESPDMAGERQRRRGTPDAKKFNPRRYGGKELCIVVSYSKDGNRDVKKLAMALTHKAHVQYPGNRYSYETPLDWYENSRKGFNRHTHRLRKKAEEKGWWKDIPEDYHLKYTRR